MGSGVGDLGGRRWRRTRAATEWILTGGGGVDAGGVK